MTISKKAQDNGFDSLIKMEMDGDDGAEAQAEAERENGREIVTAFRTFTTEASSNRFEDKMRAVELEHGDCNAFLDPASDTYFVVSDVRRRNLKRHGMTEVEPGMTVSNRFRVFQTSERTTDEAQAEADKDGRLLDALDESRTMVGRLELNDGRSVYYVATDVPRFVPVILRGQCQAEHGEPGTIEMLVPIEDTPPGLFDRESMGGQSFRECLGMDEAPTVPGFAGEIIEEAKRTAGDVEDQAARADVIISELGGAGPELTELLAAGTTDEQREARKELAAACSNCGGWTNVGGMSQHFSGPDGCKCGMLATLPVVWRNLRAESVKPSKEMKKAHRIEPVEDEQLRPFAEFAEQEGFGTIFETWESMPYGP